MATEQTELEKISSREHAEAAHGLPRLRALVAALENVDRKTVSGNVDAFAEVCNFKEKISVICEKYQDIVSHGQSLHQNRDVELINKATNRLFKIPDDINLIRSKFSHSERAHDIKGGELRKQGLTQAEIDHFCPPITEADHKKLEQEIKALRAEEVALSAFLSDSPIFNIELLKNTSVYPEDDGQ